VPLRTLDNMRIFPVSELQVNYKKIGQIKHNIDSTLRLITFSKQHLADDLLNAYIAKTTSLKELLSSKNAQMEAENEEDAESYTQLLKTSLDFITNEILLDVQFNSEIQLFQLFRQISPDSHSLHPNKYRQNNVQIGRYLCPESDRVPVLVSEIFFQMKSIENPIIRAIYFHHELIRVHPFSDGNGRTTRMAKNWILMYKLCPPIFISDSTEKKEYVQALEKSFLYLNKGNYVWNDQIELFFEQELDRLIKNTSDVYNTVANLGNLRIKKTIANKT
jgi:Fic family protein